MYFLGYLVSEIPTLRQVESLHTLRRPNVRIPLIGVPTTVYDLSRD